MKAKKVVVIAMIACASFLLGQNTSKIYRAFIAHETVENDCLGRASCYGMPAAFVIHERWKNWQKDDAQFVRLSEVTTVDLGHTMDTLEETLQLCDVDRKCSTIWMGTGNKVRSITPY